MQRYLIITTTPQMVALTDYYDAENNFDADAGMIVCDLRKWKYTTDGVTWEEIAEDHL